MDIEIKSYEFPLAHENWRVYLTSPEVEVLVACVEAAPVGHIVLAMEGTILRLAVKPDFRRTNIGTRLLSRATDAAREFGLDMLQIVVPEVHCCPGHPDDVSAFLMANEYTATAIIEDYIFMYGQYIDGYKFVSPEWLKT